MLIWKVAVCMMKLYQVYGHPWVVEQHVCTAGVLLLRASDSSRWAEDLTNDLLDLDVPIATKDYMYMYSNLVRVHIQYITTSD